jgi:serine/threonine protein kinase
MKKLCQYLLLVVGVATRTWATEEWWRMLNVFEPTRIRKDIRDLDPGAVLTTKLGRLVIEDNVGEGSYGVVYRAHAESDINRKFAIKVQKREVLGKYYSKYAPKGYSNLDHEVRVLEAMQGVDGFTKLYASHLGNGHKYMVIELLGKSFSGRIREDPDAFESKAVVARVGAQIVSRFRDLHEKGYLMNDVHLGNFVEDEDGDLVMIDLGLAIPWTGVKATDYGVRTADGKDRYFTSRREDNDLAQSRQDDLEKLLYILVVMTGGHLPWTRYDLDSRIVMAKRRATAADICTGKASWLQPAMEHVLGLGFDEAPDYDFLIKSLLLA